jgi:hypothetical protein
MRISDILRKIADGIDSEQVEQPSVPNGPAEVEVSADLDDHTETDTMVPPLQQKIELLKKAVGVDNVYDNEGFDQPDELEQIKKNAGIATLMIASDDEPLDN